MEASDKTLLIVDDDSDLRQVLASSLRRRGLTVSAAGNAKEALAAATRNQPKYAVVDFNLGSGPTGLDVVRTLRGRDPELRILLVTGFATIDTAVEALRLGALDVLIKPVDAHRILSAFGLLQIEASPRKPAKTPRGLKSLEMNDIRKVMALTGGNISETARRLGTHRRSLQRKLANYG